MKIERLNYNWRVVSDGCQTIDVSESHVVGQNGVNEIIEHPAAGEGDKWFYYVRFDDGHVEMVFNPNLVIIKP